MLDEAAYVSDVHDALDQKGVLDQSAVSIMAGGGVCWYEAMSDGELA